MKTPRRPSPPVRVVGAILFGCLAALSAAAQARPPAVIPPGIPITPCPVKPITPPPEGIAELAGLSNGNGLPGRNTEDTINKISQLTSEQLRLSQIAAARAANQQVRSYAEQLQNSSQDLQQEIDRLAQSKSILVPAGKNSSEVAAEEREWRGKDAKGLDEAYVERVTRLHRDAIDTLEDYADDQDIDPEIVTFAHKHLPAMREHLRQAENLKQQVG